jgi:hypothetical protein
MPGRPRFATVAGMEMQRPPAATGVEPGLIHMKNLAALITVALLAGCAVLDDSTYMPSEGQLRFNNPELLKCPYGSLPVCDTQGGRVKKTFTNCGCAH